MFDQVDVVIAGLTIDMKEILDSIVTLLFKLVSFTGLLNILQQRREVVRNSIGVVALFHLLFVDGVAWHEIPLVFEQSHLLAVLQHHLQVSFHSSSTCITKTNVHVLSYLISPTCDPFSHVPLSCVTDISTSVTKIMIWCEDEEVRKLSQDLFVCILQNVDAELRLSMLQSIYQGTQHAGLHGYLIKHVNNALEEVFANGKSSKKIKVGELAVLYTKCIVGENNVLQESDRYIAGLNFVRYWLLRVMKDTNLSGIWENATKELSKNISIIVKCIDVSKKEIEGQLRRLNSSNTEGSEDDFNTELLTSLLGGEMSVVLSDDEKREISNKAFLTLDIMSSVIARIDEIIENYENT